MKDKPKQIKSKTICLLSGEKFKFKDKIQITPDLQAQGIGPFEVVRVDGAYVYLKGRTEFRVTNMQAIKLFEPCQLKISILPSQKPLDISEKHGILLGRSK